MNPTVKMLAFLLPILTLQAANPFVGRWDITVTTPTGNYPDWMEVTEKDGAPQARVQLRTGSVKPVAEARMDGGKLHLTISKSPDVIWILSADSKRLGGTIERGGETVGEIAALPAPAMKGKQPKAWTAPEPLFNGKDLTGWTPDNPGKDHWAVKDGAIFNVSGGANLRSTRWFSDFQIHLEFNCPDRGNSGLYLRGRYEVQIEYEAPGVEDPLHSMGAIYGMVPPSQELPRKPGQWETMDITLVGRYVTISRNGVKTIDHQEIPGITGGAIDANEGQPGPFYLQGDHTGGMQYRNITVSIPKK